MAEPFLSEIRIMSFGFPPKGWALCDGQLLPINQNQALFSILGTTYGGDGRQNFRLPNLQGRVPVHAGNGIALGQSAGEMAHTLTANELPTHTHTMYGSADQATSSTPGSSVVLSSKARRGKNVYAQSPSDTPLAPQAVTIVGGSQAHLNTSPSLVLNFCIALQGIFPSQN